MSAQWVQISVKVTEIENIYCVNDAGINQKINHGKITLQCFKPWVSIFVSSSHTVILWKGFLKKHTYHCSIPWGRGLAQWHCGKETTYQCRKPRFYPCLGKISHVAEQLRLWATTIKLVLHSPGATHWSLGTPEPVLQNNEKPLQWEARGPNLEGSPHFPQLGKARTSTKTQCNQKLKKKNLKTWECMRLNPDWPRDRTQVSHIAGRFFTGWVSRGYWSGQHILSTVCEMTTQILKMRKK